MVMPFFRTAAFRTATLIALSLCAASQAASAQNISVNADNANIRTGPGTNYQIAMELFKGYPLQITATQGDWSKVVDFENDTGWIHNSLVGEGNTVIVNGTQSVNMRAEASTDSAIVANVDRGVVLTIMETNGNWLKLQHSTGVVGWIYKPLLWP